MASQWSPYPGGPVYITNANGGSNIALDRTGYSSSDFDGRDYSLSGLSGSSARQVSSSASSVPSSVSQISSYLDEIYKITDRNNAWSASQAALQRDWQQRQNQIAMDYNSAEAQKNRDWQEMMSNTAHQREIQDLQRAGLNPILSASGGNGAAVTSGATASGVTSAGAKGDTDESGASALVSLLGSMWSAQTQLEATRLNAQNNLAIAEKNNSTSQLVAEIYTQQSREASQLAAEVGLKQSQISAAVSELVSRIGASASYYASDISHQNSILYTEANKIVADMNVSAQNKQTVVNGITSIARTVADFVGGQLNSQRQAQSAMDVAQENHWNNPYGSSYNLGSTLYDLLFGSSSRGSFGGNRSSGFGSK